MRGWREHEALFRWLKELYPPQKLKKMFLLYSTLVRGGMGLLFWGVCSFFVVTNEPLYTQLLILIVAVVLLSVQGFLQALQNWQQYLYKECDQLLEQERQNRQRMKESWSPEEELGP